ncbi:hypothetical protein GCM10008938_18410 [Deinococcus roseus]|uniref:RCK C-terminal domain-containing protein n=2 Tax=Deinococcus roseus TaxID=392414 RepID=A0ABQ2CZP9_9DEIO|nr:hypothetical protein GCM10008938_18410 [Deinococcus roseus]
MVLYSALAGVLVGVSSALLLSALDVVQDFLMGLAGYHPPSLPSRGGVLMAFEGNVRWWALLVLPTMAGLAVWLYRPSHIDPLAETIEHYHSGESRPIVWTLQLRRILAGFLSVGAGVPLGREGMLLSVAQATAHLTSRFGSLSKSEARTILMASGAAVLGVVFHAPLACAVIIAEILYRRNEFEFEILMPAVLSSVAAYAIYGTLMGFSPLLDLPPVETPSYWSMPLYLLLGAIIAGMANVYLQAIRALRRNLRKVRVNVLVITVAGAVGVALCSVFFDGTLGDGLGWTQLAFMGMLDDLSVYQHFMVRFVVTLMVSGAFMVGGYFTPQLVIGAFAGASLGAAINAVFPADPVNVLVFGLVGAAAFLSSTTNIPLGATLLLATWSGEEILIPLVLSTFTAYAVGGVYSLYVEQKNVRAESGAHISNIVSEALSQPAPQDLMELLRNQPVTVLRGDTEQISEIDVPSSWFGKTKGEVEIPETILVFAIAREGKIHVPNNKTPFIAGDQVMLIGEPQEVAQFQAALEAQNSEVAPAGSGVAAS